MALELETFFELHFSNINNITDNKTSDNIIYYNELSNHKELVSDIIMIIETDLRNENYQNDANYFSNYIRNGWNQNINNTKMNNFFLNNIKMVNSFNEKSKEIIINYLDILLSEKFERNDNIKRTILYYKKIMNEILIKWKKSNYSDYMDDINEFNNLLRVNNISISFCQYINILNIICPLNNIDNNIKIILLDFFDNLILKYNKQDKIKEKLKKIKESPITKIIEEYVPVVINTKITKPKSKKNMSPDDKIKNFENVVSSESDNEIKNVKPKKKKKPISSTIKKLVWNTNIGEEKGKSKCLCCKSTEITQMSFHCGHIIAESNGGETIVSNLKPICQNCNSSMGIKDMNEFMKSLK
jgi:hypothetical protein